eukprot:scaffold42576_cov54-Phaeocystis_antarctica.AAC.1
MKSLAAMDTCAHRAPSKNSGSSRIMRPRSCGSEESTVSSRSLRSLLPTHLPTSTYYYIRAFRSAAYQGRLPERSRKTTTPSAHLGGRMICPCACARSRGVYRPPYSQRTLGVCRPPSTPAVPCPHPPWTIAQAPYRRGCLVRTRGVRVGIRVRLGSGSGFDARGDANSHVAHRLVAPLHGSSVAEVDECKGRALRLISEDEVVELDISVHLQLRGKGGSDGCAKRRC